VLIPQTARLLNKLCKIAHCLHSQTELSQFVIRGGLQH